MRNGQITKLSVVKWNRGRTGVHQKKTMKTGAKFL